MVAPSLSPEPQRGRAVSEPAAAPADASNNRPLREAEAQLRRANAELELLYAVEQQITGTLELPAMIFAVLERIVTFMRSEAAALLMSTEHGADVFAVQHGKDPVHRRLDAKQAQHLVARSRTPIRRVRELSGDRVERGVNDISDLLVELSGVRASDVYSTPLLDGSGPIGVLQVIDTQDREGGEDAVLRRLALTASQLSRAIVLRREHAAALRDERLALLGHSLGAVLHDLRSPLMAVSGYVDVMVGEESPVLRREYAERAGRALSHMERMAQEMLAFARGQREVWVRSVQLIPFIDEVREMLQPEVARAGATLQIGVEYTGPARFDETKLKRVLWNLARNACQAGAKQFRWAIKREGEYLVFECSDTGPGIPEAMDGRLFESFATHGKAEGTGLGLAMAKKIIDAHCGRIQVKSDAGQGAIFRIELPI
jgi:signal transduction histidine kinase